METGDHLNAHLYKLNRLAVLSAAKSDGPGQLAAFRTISDALDSLGATTVLDSSQIIDCVSLLKNLVSLQQNMVKSNDISQKELPQVHHIAHTLNTLFVNTSRTAIKSQDTASITELCETLLQALDDFRGDAGLRTCGILDKRLKDAVGKLRERADIMTLFEGEESIRFAKIIRAAEQALDDGDLDEIGSIYAKLNQLNIGLKQKYPLKANLTPYLIKFRDEFIEKIKQRSQELKKEAAKTSLDRCSFLVEEMASLEKLGQFHGDTAVSRQIRVIRNRILADRIHPVQSALETAAGFIRENSQDHFAMGYQACYQKVHMEGDLFTPVFYTHTLKDLSARDALALLKEKQEQMSQVNLETAGQADYESRLRTVLSGLIQIFEAGSPSP